MRYKKKYFAKPFITATVTAIHTISSLANMFQIIEVLIRLAQYLPSVSKHIQENNTASLCYGGNINGSFSRYLFVSL